LNQAGSDRRRDIGSVRRTVTWVRFRSQGRVYEIGDLPGNHSNSTGSRQNGFRRLGLINRVKTRERIGFDVLGSGSVRDYEVEPREKQRPP